MPDVVSFPDRASICGVTVYQAQVVRMPWPKPIGTQYVAEAVADDAITLIRYLPKSPVGPARLYRETIDPDKWARMGFYPVYAEDGAPVFGDPERVRSAAPDRSCQKDEPSTTATNC